jgi:hypothetical protein
MESHLHHEMFRNPTVAYEKRESDFLHMCSDRHSRGRRESRFGQRRISLDTRFRGYDEKLIERRNLRRFFTQREETLWAA